MHQEVRIEPLADLVFTRETFDRLTAEDCIAIAAVFFRLAVAKNRGTYPERV